jgi:hypothetical protein
VRKSLKIKEVEILLSPAFSASCELLGRTAEQPETKRFVGAKKHEYGRMRADSSNGLLVFTIKHSRSV